VEGGGGGIGIFVIFRATDGQKKTFRRKLFLL